MPRKKSKEPEDQELEQQFQEEQGSGESAGDGESFQEYAETMEEVTPESEVPDAPYIEGYPYGEEAPVPEPVPEETSAEEDGSIKSGAAPDGDGPEEAEKGAEAVEEAEDAGYAALLQELSSSGLAPSVVDSAKPLTLEDASGEVPFPVPDAERDTEPPSAKENEAEIGEIPGTPAPRRRSTARDPARPRTEPERDRILTIDARDEVQTEAEREAILWHEIQNAHWTRRILTGTLDGVEQTESGMTVAAITYKGFRVAIPVKEMLIQSGRLPNGEEYQELMNRMRKILIARLGSEIDFIVMGHENKSRSVVGSRRAAMYRKRQNFYLDTDAQGRPMIYEGRVVQARVVAVSEKVIRVEIFGVECSIVARNLSDSWIGSAADHYSVGDRILVRILKVSGDSVENLSVSADVRSVNGSSGADIKKCVPQGRYAGKVTDIRNGVVFIRLNNGVNAIAHSCYDRRTPGKQDDVSFSVTRLNEEQGVAIGIITRIIKQNL